MTPSYSLGIIFLLLMPTTEAYQTNRTIELKCWLIRNGLTQIQVARQLGITRQYLDFILKGKRKAPKMRRRLVAEIGMPAGLIFDSDHRQAA